MHAVQKGPNILRHGCTRRPLPQLFPTNMALQNGAPVTSSATALFMLTIQMPEMRQLAPADFTITGNFSAAAATMRTAPFLGQGPGQTTTRIAVDLPAGYCGQATISLVDPSLIRHLAGGGPGPCPGNGAAVSWTRKCGPAAAALVAPAGVEVTDASLACNQCLAPPLH